jgi:hypothetical protein
MIVVKCADFLREGWVIKLCFFPELNSEKNDFQFQEQVFDKRILIKMKNKVD